uniref:Uncharacterized protein n=1 Tax=Schistocephalus solidus TaxID=70667 RepID=A0A0X3PXT4_SCHSO
MDASFNRKRLPTMTTRDHSVGLTLQTEQQQQQQPLSNKPDHTVLSHTCLHSQINNQNLTLMANNGLSPYINPHTHPHRMRQKIIEQHTSPNFSSTAILNPHCPCIYAQIGNLKSNHQYLVPLTVNKYRNLWKKADCPPSLIPFHIRRWFKPQNEGPLRRIADDLHNHTPFTACCQSYYHCPMHRLPTSQHHKRQPSVM